MLFSDMHTYNMRGVTMYKWYSLHNLHLNLHLLWYKPNYNRMCLPFLPILKLQLHHLTRFPSTSNVGPSG